MKAHIKQIEFFLPEQTLTNEQLSQEFPGWSIEKISGKTGIRTRHIVAQDECASDLAARAAEQLFAAGCPRQDVDYLLFCTQSPDYFLPTTACLLQHRLGLPSTCGAVDYNLGCSGFVYGLSLAKGLVESGQAKNVLLLTAETYSKHMHPGDKSVRTIFGDGAAATWIGAADSEREPISGLVFGTDGSGANNLIVPAGGMRRRTAPDAAEIQDDHGNRRTVNHLYMNGPEIFNFTLRTVPPAIDLVLQRGGLAREEVDLFVMHQANQHMLEHLRHKAKIPPEKCWIQMEQTGNTVSATIPIALKQAQEQGKIKPGSKVLILGFGVGYSWAGALLRWL